MYHKITSLIKSTYFYSKNLIDWTVMVVLKLRRLNKEIFS